MPDFIGHVVERRVPVDLVGRRVEEDVAMVEGGQQPYVARQKHPVAVPVVPTRQIVEQLVAINRAALLRVAGVKLVGDNPDLATASGLPDELLGSLIQLDLLDPQLGRAPDP